MDHLQSGDWAELELPGSEPPMRVRGLVEASEAGERIFAVRVPDAWPEWLRAGAPVGVRFVTAVGLHEGQAYVVSVLHREIAAVRISDFSSFTTVQRRAYYRVSVFLSVQLIVLTAEDEELIGDIDQRASTIDISAGGVRLETHLDLAIGDRMRLTLAVPPEYQQEIPRWLACDAHILRREEFAFERYRLAMQFEFPREPDRDRWVQLTLNMQRARNQELGAKRVPTPLVVPITPKK